MTLLYAPAFADESDDTQQPETSQEAQAFLDVARTATEQPDPIDVPVRETEVLYAAHTSDYGYMAVVCDGGLQGTSSPDAYVTSIEMHVGALFDGRDVHIAYCVETEDEEIPLWVSDGIWAGSNDGVDSLKGIRAELFGTDSLDYSLAYRVYDGRSWSAWAFDGASAHVEGRKSHVTLFQVQAVRAGSTLVVDDGFYTLAGIDGSEVLSSTERSGMTLFPILYISRDGPMSYNLQSVDSGKFLIANDDDSLSWSASKTDNASWKLDTSPFLTVQNTKTETTLATDTHRIELSLRTVPPPPPPPPDYVDIGVPAILQNPELPTGCESVALTEALNYYGFGLEKTTIADDYMYWSGSDFVHSFMGNPHYGGGLAIMAPGITETANRFLVMNNSKLRAYDITGTDFEDLYTYLEDDIPVVVWSTIGFSYPGGAMMFQEGFTMRTNTHCVTLSGYDKTDDTVLVADPLAGFVKRDRQRFENIYILMGSQAVIIQ